MFAYIRWNSLIYLILQETTVTNSKEIKLMDAKHNDDISTMKEEAVMIQENPAYGQIGSDKI